MISFDQELRLLHCVALNAIVIVSAWRLVRRAGVADSFQAVLDAGVLWFLVQYLSMGLPEVAGFLSNWTMTATAVLLSGAMWIPYRRNAAVPFSKTIEYAVTLACFLFLLAYSAALVYQQRYMPVTSIDALAYHLPAAVDWLRSGRIGLHEIWFYNPANAYSPLGGSVFAVWWIAPMGSDVLVRFMQVPAMIVLAVGLMQIGRNLGASISVASLIATAAVLSRPIISESILPKDDLFLSAFFVAAVARLGGSAMRDRLAPWRIGTAAGLFLATKYTALLTAPMLLLAIDAPFRAQWNWRRWGIALVCVIVLAGPWYLRNILLTGNPLYPVDSVLFTGMFQTTPSEQLHSVSGVWHVLTGAYHSLPVPLMVVLIAAWVAAIGIGGRRLLSDPVFRLCALGPVIGVAIFVMASPYPEIRFVYPSLMLMACAGVVTVTGIERVMSRVAGTRLVAIAVGVLLAAMVVFVSGTAFFGELGWDFAMVGIFVSLLGTSAWLVMRGLNASPPVPMGTVVLVGLAGGLYAFVYWQSYVRVYRESPYVSWTVHYGPTVDAWKFVREELPRHSVVAYANTYLTYPLYGFDLDRKVVYAPLSDKLNRYEDLPPFPERVTDQNMRRLVEQITLADPDLTAWLRHLSERKATHLLVVKPDPASGFVTALPPELEFASQRPEMFKRVFDNPVASVFSIENAVSAN